MIDELNKDRIKYMIKYMIKDIRPNYKENANSSFSDLLGLFSIWDGKYIRDYISNPDKYVFQYKTSVNGKSRQIVTYQSTTDGQMLRHMHRLFALALNRVYEPHSNSFAYQKGKGIDFCLKNHLCSDTFLKTDIHSYFDTISYDLLCERLLSIRRWPIARIPLLKRFLSTCFYQGRLPIGFVTSPILSDIFLNDLDECMSTLRRIHYTRYADDFIISASGQNAKEKLEHAFEILQLEIKKHNLELNKKKTYYRQLKIEGDAIHLLGLNLVKTRSSKNRITVSQRYINETSKDIGYLFQNRNNWAPWEMRRHFVSAMGKVTFISHMSKSSLAKLKKLLWLKTGYNGQLTYKALSSMLFDDASILQEYEQEKQIEAYVRIEHLKLFPSTGRCWERVEIPANNIKARNTLRYYLFSICREFERDTKRLSINRMTLSVGKDIFHFQEPWDTNHFRTQIKKLRTESAEVSYSSDFEFNNGQPSNKLLPNGKCDYSIPSYFRPLLDMEAVGNCILFSAQNNCWIFFREQDAQISQGKQNLEEANLTDFMKHTEWEGCMDLDLRLPLQIAEEISKKLDASFRKTTHLLKPWLGNIQSPNNLKCLQAHRISIRADAQTLITLIDSLQELSSLIKQSNGINNINAWFVPVGFLEAKKETWLTYIKISTSNAKFKMFKFQENEERNDF